MIQLCSFLADANIFKNYILKEHTCVAVRNDSQIFSASLNVVKTAPIYHQQNYFKLVNISSSPPFKVCQLVLNHSQTLLAVVGASNVAIIDVKDPVDFDSPEPVWNCFDVSVTIPGSSPNRKRPLIKSVLWHPASSKDSELIILTDDAVLLYDIVLSLTEPILTVHFSDLHQLSKKSVLSIAFGSYQNFAGAITLYLSTKCGLIYALFPFISKSSTIKTSKALLLVFVDDWNTILQGYNEKLPPAATFASYHAVFAHHSAFVDRLEAKLKSPLFAEADHAQNLSFSIDDIDVPDLELMGPLTETGPDCKVVQTCGNSEHLVLASIHRDNMGKIILTHFSQIIPLVISIQEPSDLLQKPVKPVKGENQPKDPQYTKPRRGFGYVMEFDDTLNDEADKFEQQMRAYDEDMRVYNVKQKISTFISTTFNKLTVMSTDSTDLQYAKNSFFSFQNIFKWKVLVALEGSILIGDLEYATGSILNPRSSSFEVSYKLMDSKTAASGFAYVKDTIEGSGEYLIACSSLNETKVFRVEGSERETRQSFPNLTLPVKPRSESHALKITLPAEELKMIKADAGHPLVGERNIDPSRFESLEVVHSIVADLMRKIGALTKFTIALQTKVEIQFENLKLQTSELLAVNEVTSDKEKYFKNRERIGKLIERQEKLLKKQESLRRSIVERFEKARAEQKLPLSRAEKLWLKELNSITTAVAIGDKETPSLSARVDFLKAKILALKDSQQSLDNEGQLSHMLSNLLLGANLSRVALLLSLEGTVLSNTRSTLDHCLALLQDVLQV